MVTITWYSLYKRLRRISQIFWLALSQSDNQNLGLFYHFYALRHHFKFKNRPVNTETFQSKIIQKEKNVQKGIPTITTKNYSSSVFVIKVHCTEVYSKFKTQSKVITIEVRSLVEDSISYTFSHNSRVCWIYFFQLQGGVSAHFTYTYTMTWVARAF